VVSLRLLLSEVRRLLADAPSNGGILDQCLLRSLVVQVLGRIIRTYEMDQNPTIARAFFACASAGLTPGQWHLECTRLLDCCDAVLEDCMKGDDTIAHTQVAGALRFIGVRFCDVALNLNVVASHVGASPCHLSRLLKTHTGDGFLRHVHQRRVSAARRLLADSQLSVKEIAAAVGYRSVTQLDRHFRRLCGSTPASARSQFELRINIAAPHTPS
jgi:AraC-like DNA-binding protein